MTKTINLSLVKQINKVTRYFAFLDNFIILFFKYKRFKFENSDKFLYVDSYYIISNKSYHLTKKLAKALPIDAELDNSLNYKLITSKLPGFKYGKNGLIYNNIIGSNFYIQILKTNQDFETALSKPLLKSKTDIDICEGCDRCKKICPTKILSDSQNINYSGCVRSLMNKDSLDEKEKAFTKNRLFGCGLCLDACPINKKPINTPKKIKKLFKKDVLLNNIKNNNLKIYEKILGKNYARKNILLKHYENATKEK